MTDETTLLSCPFCGGEAETLTAERTDGYIFWVMCQDCCSCVDGYDTEAEAIAAWNTRTERTCHVNELDALTQTLSMANGCSWGECSECGCLTPTDSVFCVECGAKVVGE